MHIISLNSNTSKNFTFIIIPLCVLLLQVIFPKRIFSESYYTTVTIHGWVYNIENPRNYMPGVDMEITASVYYTYTQIIGGEHEIYEEETLIKTATTDKSGFFNVSFNLENVYTIYDISATLEDISGWLLIDTKKRELTDTSIEYEFYVLPIIDDDNNGIHDPYEIILAKKFAPTLVPNKLV